MKPYYETGLLLKLYTNEGESEAVRKFVVRRREALARKAGLRVVNPLN